MRVISFLIMILANQLLYEESTTAGWTQCSGVEGGIVQTVLSTEGVVLAGTKYGGIFRSTDSGGHWEHIDSYLTGTDVTSLVASGRDIFAGTLGFGVNFSTDAGATWRTINSGLSNMRVKALLVNDKELYAGTLGGVFRSTDRGAHWLSVSMGLSNPYVFCLCTDGNRIYAGTYGSGVFVSTNRGQSWIEANVGITNGDIFGIASHGSCTYAGTLGDGVFRSTNAGRNWQSVNHGLECLFISSFVSKGDTLFAGTFDDGVFFSVDLGDTWKRPSIGLNRMNIQAMGLAGDVLFAGTYLDGVSSSFDGGMKWASANSGLWNTTFTSFAGKGDTIFAGVHGGVARSTDKGMEWCKCGSGITNPNVMSVCTMDRLVVAGTFGGVFMSTDMGITWIERNNGLRNMSVLSVASCDSFLFAGTFEGGVFRSSDRGAEWRLMGLSGFNVNMLVLSGNSIYAATDSGVYFSNIHSNVWVLADARFGGMGATSVAVSPTHIYAGSRDGFIVVAHRSERRYTEDRTRLSACSVSSIVLTEHGVFAATYGRGIFRSTNEGTSWSEWNEGLPNQRLKAIALQGDALRVATDGNGVWQAVIDPDLVSATRNSINRPPDAFMLEQNFPNPFNPSTRIRYQISEANYVSLMVYDVSGREVRTLVNERLQPGSYETTFDAKGLASGVYFYRLGAGDLVETRALMLMK